MDSARSERVCRYFTNGGCRLGSRCKYRHERPLPGQLCRYFQKGGCWYGDSCRYLHVLQPEGAGRRCSAPAVSSNVAHAALDRRGSQPAVLPGWDRRGSQPAVLPGWDRRGSQPAVLPGWDRRGSQPAALPGWDRRGSQPAALPGQQSRQSQSFTLVLNDGDTGQRAEKQPEGSESPSSTELPLEQKAKESQEAVGSDAGAEKDDCAAASSDTREKVPVTCGICMDNVYEKKPPRDNVFGILPNCNHAFCKQCITTWRKMKEYGPDVVKSCPQCRVKSAFYVPSKLWVEGQEKARLIAAFRQRCSKKSCQYFSRYRCCPFETECLYLHDKRARWMSPSPTEEDDDYVVDPLNLLLALTLLGGDVDDEEDSLDFPFYLSVEYNL